MDWQLETYYPIFIYLVFVVGFAITTLVLAHLIGPRRDTPVKLMTYESGMDPVGDARQRFDVRFYIMAIMFLVFDVELLFLYPYAVAAYQEPSLWPEVLRRPIFWSALVFLLLLVISYVYDWRKGAFRWR